MASFRTERVGAQIRDEISAMILRGDIKDPRVSTFLSVNRVEVTGDLAFAKVYVSSFLGDKKTGEGVAGLQSAAGYIRSVLGKKLFIRQFPKLTFVHDSSIKEGLEMLKVLDSLAAPGDSARAPGIPRPL
jgi:ribosome-binding factor A